MFRATKKIFSKFKGAGKKMSASAFALVAVMTVSATSAFASSNPGDTPVAMTNVTLPFTVQGMLGTATNFLGMYGTWVLLALGVLFAPVLIGLALKLVGYLKARMAIK